MTFSFRWVTLPFDVINALQGLVLFCVIFFDTRRLEMIWQRVCLCRSQPGASRKASRIMTTASEARQRKLTAAQQRMQDPATPADDDAGSARTTRVEEAIELEDGPRVAG